MTKRVLSGVFILVALIALGVIIAGALNSGDQLLVRFLTAVVVAALGIYVISDLRLQTDESMKAAATSSSFRDLTMAVSSNTPVAKPVTQMVPISTAEFMDTVTSTSNQRVVFEEQEAMSSALSTVNSDGLPQDFYFSGDDFSEDPDDIFADMDVAGDESGGSLEENEITDEVVVDEIRETMPSIFTDEEILLDVDLGERTDTIDDLALPVPEQTDGNQNEGYNWPGKDEDLALVAETVEGEDLTGEAMVVEGIFKSDKDLFASLEAELEHLEPIAQEQLADESEAKVVSLLDAEGNVKSLGRLEPKEPEEVKKPTVSEALAPIIDLREGQSVEVSSTIDSAIKTGELEVISTLIEQGMLSTEGEISDRDVRTMVYVAFTSNELRKLIKAGGNPDEPNPDIDLGPVELFDETVHAPAPKTLYVGRAKESEGQAAIDVRVSGTMDKESV